RPLIGPSLSMIWAKAMFALCGNSRGDGFVECRETPKMLIKNLGAPRSTSLPNTSMSALIGAGRSAVSAVLRIGDSTQIHPTIVRTIAIDVIDLRMRPRARHPQIDNAMSKRVPITKEGTG